MYTKKAKVFTFGFGADASYALPRLKAIACENDGLYFSFGDNSNLATGMASYYQFFAAGINTDSISWSLPYVDDPEIGLVLFFLLIITHSVYR